MDDKDDDVGISMDMFLFLDTAPHEQVTLRTIFTWICT